MKGANEHDIPCYYCGKTPTWPVTWYVDGRTSEIYLCEECDEEESSFLDFLDSDTHE